ncbi:helix-turn-helix domain-containing protein [Streptobacillus moniliformis]|uniref:helix-turn-helix domain-containing protein n=1 Tax=Streptobacillus moniliformis TaxID=34105 RepID=UPI000AE2D927|nr:helix-turn-helix domain-containing protein [Streptobacillus moniliformis]
MDLEALNEKIKEKIKEKGLKKNYIAKKLGIQYATLNNKLKGEGEFLFSEIKALIDVLNLTEKEKKEIFFN